MDDKPEFYWEVTSRVLLEGGLGWSGGTGKHKERLTSSQAYKTKRKKKRKAKRKAQRQAKKK